jgi:hypothetical protein
MAAQELQSKLRGVMAFPVTPFASDLSLDTAGLRTNLRKLLAFGRSNRRRRRNGRGLFSHPGGTLGGRESHC